MNVKAKFIGKVNHIVDGVVYTPGMECTVDSELAKHPFFEIKETPKPKPAPKPKPKSED